MNYYLVEAYSPHLQFRNNSYVVALTPLAVYELDKADIKYSIIEDYYDEAEFLKEEEAFFKDQLIWFDKFDNFLFDIFPEAKAKNLKLATSYYFYIKSMLDSLILRCKIMNEFINKTMPDSIIYVSTRWEEDSISSAEYPLLFRKGQSLFSRIIPIFCKKNCIDFERKIVEETIGLGDIHTGYKDFFIKIKNSLKANKHVRNLWHNYKMFSINDICLRPFENHKRNMLFLKTPNFVKNIMKEFKKEGHGVYYKQDNYIIKQSFPFHKVGHILSNSTLVMKYDIESLSKEIEKTDIVGWVNKYCVINISAIILPRILHFINNFCSQLITIIDKYVAFYNDNQIDMVFSPHMVSVDEFAAIIAARYTEKTKSACLHHGDSVFLLKLWDVSAFSPYHMYFSSNYEIRDYIKNRIEIGNLVTKVFQYPNRYKILPKINKPKKKRGSLANKKTLVYVPIMNQWDNTFWNEARVPDTWYFSWQKELIKFFSSRKDYNFIWKGIPDSNEIYDPIPNLIADQVYKNIHYVTEPFVKWIKKTDLVLLDYPSTALYEAALRGLPVMSLFFEPYAVVRETAIELFGKSLQPFSNFDEGITKIKNYLNSPSDDFIVSIPYSEKSIVETLDYIKK